MLNDITITILWSLSPFGEAKVGIPYGLLNGINPFIVFGVALLANILVFPLMMLFLDKVNVMFTRWFWYKKCALWIARRAKKGTGKKLDKYGYFGLALFVMIPLPGTGVYAGSIATYLFNMERKKAFFASSIGITISSMIIWSITSLSSGII